MYCDNSFQLENRKEKIPNPFSQTFSNNWVNIYELLYLKIY